MCGTKTSKAPTQVNSLYISPLCFRGQMMTSVPKHENERMQIDLIEIRKADWFAYVNMYESTKVIDNLEPNLVPRVIFVGAVRI